MRAIGLTLNAVGMVLALAALVTLSGCAVTLTAAAGKDAFAKLRAPAPATCPQVVAPTGTKTTVTEKVNDRVGFKPQLEERTTVTEPAPPPEAPAEAESHGAELSKGGKHFLISTLKFLGCLGSLGAICVP